jgi:hypothetical protein
LLGICRPFPLVELIRRKQLMPVRQKRSDGISGYGVSDISRMRPPLPRTACIPITEIAHAMIARGSNQAQVLQRKG